MELNKTNAQGNFVQENETKKQKEVKKPNKNKKPGFFKRMGTKIKDMFAELKKVSWPKFPKIVKQTGIVLAVVLIFLVVITAFDTGLVELLRLISPSNV